MNDTFDFDEYFTALINSVSQKECCNNCVHSKEAGKCELFEVTKQYPDNEKCWLYGKRKEE